MSPCALLLPLSLLVACGAEQPPARGGIPVAEALGGGGDPAGYARALAPRPLRFPDDHGPHPDFRSEWWYFTGNLDAADGRRFGYHLTLFRNATQPDPPPADGSAWRTRQLWMAHFALTDVAAGSMHAAERFARGAVGLAGATAVPFAVHVDDWSVRSTGTAFAPLALSARDGDTALELELRPEKPPVLQGEHGLSQKGRQLGNASYYYSLTRLRAQGTVRAGGAAIAVSGTGWCDREWSTSALDADQVGWDWLALQLDDGRDVMFYRMRRADGSADPHSSGVVVGADGTVSRLVLDDVALERTGTWTSPRSGADYPAGFRLAISGHDLDLRVTPVIADQELDLTFRYFEGAVDVAGTAGTRPVAGRGYLEMTGYADRREGGG